MRSNHRILTITCVCLLAAALSFGCAKKTQVTTAPVDTTVKSEPASPAVSTPVVEPVPEVSDGPITTPATGSDERTALMDAARKKLSTTSQFVVYQLYVQGDAAVADLEMVSGGKRQFVIFKGTPPEWDAVWVAAFGSAGASEAGAKKGVSGVSDKLLGKLDWKYKKPASSAAMRASLSTAAKKWTKSLMSGVGEPYSVTTVKVAQDSKGVWWGRAVVQPASSASSAYESIEFWAKYSGGAWTGKAQDPEPPAPTTYFPSSVIGALGL
jgi:hypothetical protein